MQGVFFAQALMANVVLGLALLLILLAIFLRTARGAMLATAAGMFAGVGLVLLIATAYRVDLLTPAGCLALGGCVL